MGRFRHGGPHPARALLLAGRERLLEALLGAGDGLEVAELLERATGKVEAMDLVEAAYGIWYWNPRRAVAWARAAFAPKEKAREISVEEAKEEA